jgi:hypothetical protein
MFGFGKPKDHVPELLEYMIERMGFRARYAGAFLSTYSKQVSKLFEDGIDRMEKTGALNHPMVRLGLVNVPDHRELALIGQAYKAFTSDLRNGRHIGHEAEAAIWVLLCDNLEFVRSINPGLALYLTEKQPELFPNIFQEVYES